MTDLIQLGDLKVASEFRDFINVEVLPGTGVAAEAFWAALGKLVHEFGPRNRDLLKIRDDLQDQIDQWHRDRRSSPFDQQAYEGFLAEIGYLVPEGADFQVTTANVDSEISTVAGPQLVVPVSNARYAINAANARWGSLYDALYGTDALGDRPVAGGYDSDRGARVVAAGREFLNKHVALDNASFDSVAGFACDAGHLVAVMSDGSRVKLADPGQFVGYRGDASQPECVLLQHNGLHIEIQIDRNHAIGSTDAAGISDIVLESALTTICDLEDSIAAVDAADKVAAYRNWLGLMKGDLVEEFAKGGQSIRRTLNADRAYMSSDGGSLSLPGRSLLLVRNVGHLMESDAVLDREGKPIMEGHCSTGWCRQ